MYSSAHVVEQVHGNVVEFDLHGQLDLDDYEFFLPILNGMLRDHAKIRVLVRMHDFEGWNAGALWEDIKWNVTHSHRIERLAVVGGQTWHRWVRIFCLPFTCPDTRYFTADQIRKARIWVREKEPAHRPWTTPSPLRGRICPL